MDTINQETFNKQMANYKLSQDSSQNLFRLGELLVNFFKLIDDRKDEFIQQDVGFQLYTSKLKLIKYFLENKNKEGENAISISFSSKKDIPFKLKDKEILNDELVNVVFDHLYKSVKSILNLSDADLYYIIFERRLYKDWTMLHKYKPLKVKEWLSLFRSYFKIETICEPHDLTISHIDFLLDFARRDSLSKIGKKTETEQYIRNKTLKEAKVYHMNYFIYYFLNYLRANKILVKKTNENTLISDLEGYFIYDFLQYFNCLQNTCIDNTNTTTKPKIIRSLYTGFLKVKNKASEHFNYDKYDANMNIFFIYNDLIEILKVYFSSFKFQ